MTERIGSFGWNLNLSSKYFFLLFLVFVVHEICTSSPAKNVLNTRSYVKPPVSIEQT